MLEIARSDRRPHRSEIGAKNYYKRVGDSNIAMEHYDVEDAFRRLTVASLEVVSTLSAGSTRNDERQVLITLALKNISQVTARFPYLIMALGSLGSRPINPFVHSRYEDRIHFSGAADVVVHPDVTIPVVEYAYPIKVRRNGDIVFGVPTELEPFSIDCRFGSLNSRQEMRTIRYEPGDLIHALPGVGIATVSILHS